jgi:hypothetical protein
MPCGTFTISKIPANQVGAVMQQFQFDNPTSLTQNQAADGTWTVTAVFPPCPGGSNPTTASTYSNT